MINDERKTPATYLEHHKQPVCNLYLNPGNVTRNGTEVCIIFLQKYQLFTKIYLIVADVDCYPTLRAIYYCKRGLLNLAMRHAIRPLFITIDRGHSSCGSGWSGDHSLTCAKIIF